MPLFSAIKKYCRVDNPSLFIQVSQHSSQFYNHGYHILRKGDLIRSFFRSGS